MHPSAAFEPGHYHLSVHTISKLKGDSVLAMAAYRHAEQFRQDNQSVTHAAAYQRAQQLGNDGKVFDYRRKIGVAWTGIIAPDHTPKQLLDAQTLWNTVERIEHRKNARLAREMIIALPHQVDLDIHIAMLRAFITANLTPRGMIADVAIHKPPVEHGGDPRNWHAHVLLTDRPITPDGFAAKKDRTWNAKENILLWRKAWADTHNATMAHLGLPHRIDHRSLEAQRQDALARGDVIAALDLDRTPQIHVGKAVHVTHPDRTVYAERRTRNAAILTRNKDEAAVRADRMRGQIADADNDAYLEARQNAFTRDTFELDGSASIEELQTTYGRAPATSMLGRMKDKAFAGDVHRQAMAISRHHGHPWRANGDRPGAPSLFDVLTGMIRGGKPGHPVFTVTARDLAFAFYNMGLINRQNLQKSLENVVQEEQQQHADRVSTKKAKAIWPPPPPKRSSPVLARTKAEHLARLRSFAPVPENIYLKRLDQLNAFNARHQAKARGKGRQQSQMLDRALKINVPPRRVLSLALPVGTGLV
jgi:MobA/MobL family